MFLKQVHVAAAALLAFSAGAASANTVFSENFDSFSNLITSNNYAPIFANSTALSPWTIGDTSVDLVNGGQHGAISGVSVDLAGTPGPGSISRSFAAIAGYTYTLTFDLFKNGAGDILTVELGSSTGTFPVVSSVTSQQMSWVAGITGTASVKFSSIGSSSGQYTNSFGPVIDNVILTAVPEPGAYAMMLAGLAVVGFVTTRRRI